MFIVEVLTLSSVKILPLVTAVLFVALRQQTNRDRNAMFVNAVAGSFLAILASRIVQNLSERPRPIYADIEGFVLPYGADSTIPADWSSFPSDTAALAFALATCVLLRSRLLGLCCVLWAIVVVSAPRVYAGYHYPSDMIVGALLGILPVYLSRKFMPKFILDKSYRVHQKFAPLYYSALFVVLYTTTTMFFDIRQVSDALVSTIVDGGSPPDRS